MMFIILIARPITTYLFLPFHILPFLPPGAHYIFNGFWLLSKGAGDGGAAGAAGGGNKLIRP